MRRLVGTDAWGYLHRKLKRKVYIYLAIFIIMTGISAYDILSGHINILLAAGAWGLGFLLGYLSGRAKKILWHQEEELVVGKRDKKGIVVLIIYIVFALTRREIFGYWLHGIMLTAFCFCLIAGTRLGRIIRLRRKIRKVLLEQGLI
ncbi:MAG: DUF1453 family protein [Sphingobacteriales bacterium]|nr:MAG: DUF1453 family protein [Sphingobacteriales bacterium]